ncbi:nicotinamide riboside transporter PnuC [Glaciecola sp. 1036]|uniref:nicotinamide riboside transporter PnuC n=1 Tax=Alteromonadaceae TaxID=72275 RepID=UPI003D014D10
MEIFETIIAQWQQQNLLEIIAVTLSVAYVWLAAEESVWCWPAALLSTTLYTYIFWDVSYLFQMLLNAYYMVMAVVGWSMWYKGKQNQQLEVKFMSLKQHLIIISIGVIITSILVIFAASWLSYDQLILDASITVFSLLATVLTVKKYLQTWIYWTIINAASIYLFAQAQLYFTCFLMVIYIMIAVKGYLQWRNSAILSLEQAQHV